MRIDNYSPNVGNSKSVQYQTVLANETKTVTAALVFSSITPMINYDWKEGLGEERRWNTTISMNC